MQIGIIWQGAYGEIEQGKGALPTEDTLFGICSVSKTFTAAAVMKLVDKGMVSLDEPVVTYIPDFKMEDPRYSRYHGAHAAQSQLGPAWAIDSRRNDTGFALPHLC